MDFQKQNGFLLYDYINLYIYQRIVHANCMRSVVDNSCLPQRQPRVSIDQCLGHLIIARISYYSLGCQSKSSPAISCKTRELIEMEPNSLSEADTKIRIMQEQHVKLQYKSIRQLRDNLLQRGPVQIICHRNQISESGCNEET